MAKIKVNVENIGGSKKNSVQLDRGSVNIVRGSSSSGKSSLMRGIHLGIVGRANKHADEIESLHLDDRSSDQALLMRGSSEGSVSVEFDGKKMSATIPRNGMIKGVNSNEKGVYTTMLSSLPPTKLHQAVMNPDADDPDDFIWVMNELSDAGKFQKWHDVLRSLDQELSSVKIRFEDWKKSRSGSQSKQDDILAKMAEIDERGVARASKSGKEIADLEESLASQNRIVEKNRAEYGRIASDLQEVTSANEQQMRRIDGAEKQLRVAQSKLDEAEDLLDMVLIAPNMEKLDAAVSAASKKVDRYQGDEHSPEVNSAIDTYRANSDGISKDYPSHANSMDILISMVGDNEALASALEEERAVKSARDTAVRGYMDKRSKLGSAEQQAAAARSDIQAARSSKAEAQRAMTVDAGGVKKMEADLDKVKRVYEASEKKALEIRERLASLDDSPERRRDETEKKLLEAELKTMDTSTMFEVRFSSLQMLPNQTRRYTQSQAESVFGTGEGKERTEFVTALLDASVPDIRSRIIDEIDNGFLSDVSVTSVWAATEADKQRQETRRIFNEVGTTLFERLAVSPINSVSLDTNYNLRTAWADGTVTGLSGAGGERTIVAAALLISMRKAYTPEVPILMFDGMLENLDPDSMKSLLDFLSEYAKSEDIAVVVSLFDSSESKAVVSTR